MFRRGTALLLVLPAALVYAGLFVAASVYFLLVSFWSVRGFRLSPTLTLKNYAETFTTYLEPTATTLLLALGIAVLTTAVAFAYAWLIRFRAGRLGEALLFVALVTLFGGYLMKIYAWKTMLGSDGAINTALLWLGLVDRPIAALLYSPFAVVLTLSHFLLPFAILPIAAAMRGIADAEVESARDLGASGWRVLVDVVVPRARGGILAGFALAFLIAAGDYLTPQLVGGKMAMIGQLIAPQFGTFFNWPLGAAMSFSVLLAALLALAALNAALARAGRPS